MFGACGGHRGEQRTRRSRRSDKRELAEGNSPMTEAWIIDAARTPRGIGKPGKGRLTEVHPQRILSTVLKALAERNNINTAEIDDIIVGGNSQWGKQDDCIARMPSLAAGYSPLSPGFSL